MTAHQRLKNKIEIDRNTACWNWLSWKEWNNYGRFWYNGKSEKAHRASYMIFIGSIPAGMCICHRCDNPSCVNPEHLFLGTKADNNIDKTNKGRQARGQQVARLGSQHGMAKLTEHNVKQIKSYIQEGLTDSELSRYYQVSRKTINLIRNGKTWRHVL